MHLFELTNIHYTVGPDFQVACFGQLRYSLRYRQRGYNPKTYSFRPVKVESPYGFNGKAHKIKGSKQAKYAIQLLMEACPPCILVT